jgi:hypothetical protein
MSRAGRKRKLGKRERNGRPQRERGTDPNEIAAQLPHRTADVYWLDSRRAIPIEKRHDAKAEHPLGRLNLVGAISDAQYDAGCRFRSDVLLYRRVLDIRKERQSVAGFGQPQASTPKELDDKQAVEILASYMNAFVAIAENIGGIWGRAAQAAVKHVVVQERELDPSVFKYLSLGLSNLIVHYGLTK